jgi:hypothetical protein
LALKNSETVELWVLPVGIAIRKGDNHTKQQLLFYFFIIIRGTKKYLAISPKFKE